MEQAVSNMVKDLKCFELSKFEIYVLGVVEIVANGPRNDSN